MDDKIRFPKYQRDRKARLKHYRRYDFKGASVLDLGCNEGKMMKQAKKWGAKEVLGIDYDKIYKKKNIIIADLDEFDFDTLPEFDVILMLSLANWVKDPKRIIREAEKKCKKVFYYEGHQQEFIPDNHNELFAESQLEWRKLGEVPVGRPFYRGVKKIR